MLLALIYFVPVLMMLLGSVKPQYQAARFDLSWPDEFLFTNYAEVIQTGKIWNGYKNSVLITVPATFARCCSVQWQGPAFLDGMTASQKRLLLFYLWADDYPANRLYLFFAEIFEYLRLLFRGDLPVYRHTPAVYHHDLLQLCERRAT